MILWLCINPFYDSVSSSQMFHRIEIYVFCFCAPFFMVQIYTCAGGTVERVGVLMSCGTAGSGKTTCEHMCTCCITWSAPSCVLLNRAQQTGQSSGGLCNQPGSRLSVCSLSGYLRHNWRSIKAEKCPLLAVTSGRCPRTPP